ncbi:MAG: hypothetical protein ACK4XJ_12035 [Fimbriimonadaceae bacterium]
MDGQTLLQAGARGLEAQGWKYQVVVEDATLSASVGLEERFDPVHLSVAHPWAEVEALVDGLHPARFDVIRGTAIDGYRFGPSMDGFADQLQPDELD